MELDWFNPAHMREQLNDYECWCGITGATLDIPATPPNFAELRCINGHRGLKGPLWVAGPKLPAAAKRSRRYKRRPRHDEDYCILCLRTRAMLPDGVELEDHHAIDRATLIDAGKLADQPDQLGYICSTPCKGIELALRAYFDHVVDARQLD